LNNSIGIGYYSDPTSDHEVVIGNSSHTSIGGYVNWSNISDRRFKSNIDEDIPGLAFITKLRPVTYNVDESKIHNWFSEKYNDNDGSRTVNASKSKARFSGFIAQEVEAAASEVDYDFSGVDTPSDEEDFYKLRYAEFVVPLVKAIQEQQAIIEVLEKRLEALEAGKE